MRRTLPLVLAACSLALLPPAARADLPPAPNTTIPTYIHLVGSAAGVPDTVAGRFMVVVRDFANDPVPGVFVVVDFSGCPDLQIASDQLNPNLHVNCAARTVGGYTDVSGTVGMTVLGSSYAAGTYSGWGCVKIFGDGVMFGVVTASAFDLTGFGGVDTADLSAWLADLGSHVYRGRSDYDGNGTLSTADLSVWLAENGTHRSAVTAATCP